MKASISKWVRWMLSLFNIWKTMRDYLLLGIFIR